MKTIPFASRLMARAFALLIVALVLMTASVVVMAQPFLRAAPYEFPPNIPQSAYTFSATAVPGPFSLPCTVGADRVPACNAAPALAVSVPLVTFVMKVTRTAGCDAIGANCWTVGEASSTPFERRTLDGSVAAPSGLLLAP